MSRCGQSYAKCTKLPWDVEAGVRKCLVDEAGAGVQRKCMMKSRSTRELKEQLIAASEIFGSQCFSGEIYGSQIALIGRESVANISSTENVSFVLYASAFKRYQQGRRLSALEMQAAPVTYSSSVADARRNSGCLRTDEFKEQLGRTPNVQCSVQCRRISDPLAPIFGSRSHDENAYHVNIQRSRRKRGV